MEQLQPALNPDPDDRRHDATTRRAVAGLAATAVVGSAVAVATQVVGWLRTAGEHGNAGLASVMYVTVALGLSVLGITAATLNARRRSLWTAAFVLLPPALYLLPVWFLSVPLFIACLGAAASAFLIGHRQRCRRVRPPAA